MSDSPRSYSPDRSRSPRRRDSPPPESSGIGEEGGSNRGNNIYVAGLTVSTSEGELRDRFAKYGKVLECTLVRDPRSKESRGFGFVTMESVNDADAAIGALDRTDLNGSTISVQRARRATARDATPGRYLGLDRRRSMGRHERSYRDDRGGYDRGGYDRGGYDRGGYDRGGYDRGSYAYDRSGYDRGYDRSTYDRPYDRPYDDRRDDRYRGYAPSSSYDHRSSDYRSSSRYQPYDRRSPVRRSRSRD